MIQFIFSAIIHYLYRLNEHSLHAPLIYDLYTKIIKPISSVPEDPEIESFRNSLKNSKQEIIVEDFGAGAHKNPHRKISDIVNRAVSDKKKSILICQIASFFNVKSIIELGTSLGVNTLYLSKNNESAVTTFEGSESLVNLAKTHFDQFRRKNIKIIRGNIDVTLNDYLMQFPSFDFAFIDANHRYKPTLQYYQTLLKYSHKKSILIFDDIHYSSGMSKAWKEIINKKEVTMSIDLFYIGVVFFDPSLQKKHYILGY